MARWNPTAPDVLTPRERYIWVVGYSNGYLNRPDTETIKSRTHPEIYFAGRKRGEADAK